VVLHRWHGRLHPRGGQHGDEHGDEHGGEPVTAVAGTRGVVAGGHPATVDAALTTLRAGGNAYDAVVAAGVAAAVAEPCLTSLGGGGFALVRTAAGEETLVDFFVDTPGRGRAGPPPELTAVTLRFGSAEQVFHVGHGSIAVPGCLDGYLHLHRRFGRLELDRVLAPARRLATDGVVLGADQAAVVRLLRPTFSLTEAGRAAFVPTDRPFGDDDVYRNPALADLLAEVARGTVTGIASPALATTIARDAETNGGSLTAEDLAAYEVVERVPLVVEVPGGRLLTNPPPSFGGSLLAAAIAQLEAEGPRGPAGSGRRLTQLADVLDAVLRRHLGVGPRTSTGTTHISVIDGDGDLVAMTTSNGSGSGVTLGDSGIFANNVMGETDLHPDGLHTAPVGQRVGSMMAPSVLVRPGAPDVALGSGGSERIRSALTQVLAHLLDDGVSLADAVLAPRIHWDGTTVQVEPGVDPVAVAQLAATRPVNVWERTDLYFGGVHAVDTAGAAVGDPRRGGCTASLDGADGRGPGRR
jgi:gamma-glutamyltranspeptidase / glutathione hydrolase